VKIFEKLEKKITIPKDKRAPNNRISRINTTENKTFFWKMNPNLKLGM
jgi:hypothetical protein